MKPIVWIERVPRKCRICSKKIDKKFIEGVLAVSTTWVIMCPSCHKDHGIGLGKNKGYMYIKNKSEFIYNEKNS